MAFVLAALVAAGVDWWSVATHRSSIERIAKPAVMAALLAALVAGDGSTARTLVFVAVALSLVGDVLLLPEHDRFVEGLAAFLAAHAAYAVAFASLGFATVGVLAGAVLGLLAMGTVGTRVVAGATRENETLGRAVIAYITVLAIMLTTALGTRSPLVVAGALVFAASDGVLGWNRFVTSLPMGRLITHVLYHVGQILIVVDVR